MNIKDVPYCKKCNAVERIYYTENSGQTWYCAECNSRCSYAGTGTHIIGNMFVAVGDLYGTLVIPEGVTRIWTKSISGTSIRSIQFPRSLKEIPFQCFKNCRNLQELVIPSTITEISSDAFEGCSNLRNLLIKGATEIGPSAFGHCTSLKSVVLEKYAKTARSAFEGCVNLKEATIGGNLGDSWSESPVLRYFTPFDICSSLEEITFAPNAKIGDMDLSNIPNLKKVSLLCPIHETSGGFYAHGVKFTNCKNLETVEFESVEKIGMSTFAGCERLKKVTLPNNCIEVGGFSRCTSLKNITIPKSVKKISEYAFNECLQLESFAVPEGVEEIGRYAFAGCIQLKKITLPSTLKIIGAHAFDGCTSLENITLPTGIEEIGTEAFNQCARIRVLSLPASLKKIGDRAFCSLPISFVIIPQGITELGEEVFVARQSPYYQTCHYITPHNDYAEEYLETHGLSYEVYETTNLKDGLVAEGPINAGVLYYAKPQNRKIKIPPDVVVIEAYAVPPHTEAINIALSDSVKEVKANAFANCLNVDCISFGDSLERIGSNAFPGLRDQVIDLPTSIKELAADAFGPGCFITIAGEMPQYHARRSVLAAKKLDIANREKTIADTETLLKRLKPELEDYEAAVPQDFANIPRYREEVREIESRRRTHTASAAAQKAELDSKITKVESDLRVLEEQRNACFFLALSKKKALDEDILKKQNELSLLQEEQKKLNAEIAAADARLMAELTPVKNTLQTAESTQQRWQAARQSKVATIANAERTLLFQRTELTALKASLEKETQALDEEHLQWLNAKESAIQRQREHELLLEKKRLLSGLNAPIPNDVVHFHYKPKETIVEEALLNEAFEKALNTWNYAAYAVKHNQFVDVHSSEIARVKEINLLLGNAADDGISQYQPINLPPMTDTIPDRFTKIAAYFAGTREWLPLKQATESVSVANNPTENPFDKFFSGMEYVHLADDYTHLLLFPYCIVICQEAKPIAAFPYTIAAFEVTSTEETATFDDIPPHGELLSQRHMHLNQDGSVSKRYKHNPLIKTVRFSSFTITCGRQHVTIPVDTYQAAMDCKAAFDSYQYALAAGKYRDIYAAILDSADLETVTGIITHYTTEEKRRAEEEIQRIEAKRIAAQVAAEEKRRAIIQRQKERNEERKRQEAEKRSILRIFEDDSDEKTQEADVDRPSLTAPFETVGSRVISNNVFKATLRQIADFSTEYAACYFVSADGITISNKKKLPNSTIGTETTLGFVLLSGIDYTQMKACRMRIEENGQILGELNFKLNISFYSDF